MVTVIAMAMACNGLQWLAMACNGNSNGNCNGDDDDTLFK